MQTFLIVSILLRGSNDVTANCMWLSRVSMGQTRVAPAFCCRAWSSMDCLGRRWFCCLSSGSRWVTRAGCVLRILFCILINVLGFRGPSNVLGQSPQPCPPPSLIKQVDPHWPASRPIADPIECNQRCRARTRFGVSMRSIGDAIELSGNAFYMQ